MEARFALILLLLAGCYAKYELGFPSTAYVLSTENALMSISDARKGHNLLGLNALYHPAIDQVVNVLIEDPDAEETFLRIELLSGQHIELKPKQQLRCFQGEDLVLIQAKDTQVGDRLMGLNKEILSRIVAKKVVKRKGIYLPMTSSGSIFVNGVFVSCFGDDRLGKVYEMMFKYWYQGLNYAPEWARPYLDFNIGKKHWILQLVDFYFEKFLNA